MTNGNRLLVLLAALLGACLAGSPAWCLDKVSVRLQWVHQAQFAGFYVAQDQGLYQQAGLEVDIRQGGPGKPHPLDELAMGGSDFATSWLSEALVRRSQGTRLVNLAQVIQRSALLLITFADSGVFHPRDLAGQRVGLWRSYFAVPPRALFSNLGIAVEEVDQNVSVAPFLSGAVVAATGMLYNEYHQLYQAGVDRDEIRVFDFAELGLNFPEDGIYAMETTWRARPEMCRRFIRATLEGWRRVVQDQEQALASVMERVDEAHLASNLSHQRWMLKIMTQVITHRVGPENLGQQSPDDLDLVRRVLAEQGFLPGSLDLTDFAAPAWRRP